MLRNRDIVRALRARGNIKQALEVIWQVEWWLVQEQLLCVISSHPATTPPSISR